MKWKDDLIIIYFCSFFFAFLKIRACAFISKYFIYFRGSNFIELIFLKLSQASWTFKNNFIFLFLQKSFHFLSFIFIHQGLLSIGSSFPFFFDWEYWTDKINPFSFRVSTRMLYLYKNQLFILDGCQTFNAFSIYLFKLYLFFSQHA